MAANPGLSPKDMAKKASSVWSSLDAEEKAKWKAMARGATQPAPTAVKDEAPTQETPDVKPQLSAATKPETKAETATETQTEETHAIAEDETAADQNEQEQ